MNSLLKNTNLLYLVFVRKCYTLKLFIPTYKQALYRGKIAGSITRIEKTSDGGTWWYVVHTEPFGWSFKERKYLKLFDKKKILHREPGPACIYDNGTRIWFFNGKKHRSDGPAAIYANGTLEWWVHGRRHKTDGPAVTRADGSQEWWLNGKRHRDDGPALIMAPNSKYPNGIRYLCYKNGVEVDAFGFKIKN